jgi:pimeloyl-ACP methyl ester carboxylesterase
MQLTRAGDGPPLLILHHDIGTLPRLPFYDELARRFTVLVPSHLGYDGSQRPEWMRNVRDLAAAHQWLLSELAVTRAAQTVSIVGLGFGGWVAAEMATQAPRAFRKLVLVGAMGIKPDRGVIADQALVSYIDYVRLGFSDQAAFDRLFGADPETSRARALGRESRDVVPHRVEAVHVQRIAPAFARRRRHTDPGRLGPRRPHRAARVRERYAKTLPRARLEIVEAPGTSSRWRSRASWRSSSTNS